ncbi:hypothetical protein LCW62_005201 [Escherichia coli]|nr:hypothetical protein [Escherichia coli]
MSVIKTHTGIVITRDGEKRMKLHSTETSWVAGRCESYDKKTGYHWGAPNMRRRLLLDSIRPIKQVATREQN